MENPFSKLNLNIKDFLDVYRVLNPEGKAVFEAQMGPVLQKADPNTKALYDSLLQAAKDGLTPEEAIERLNKVSVQNGKTDKPGQDQAKP